MIRAKTWVSMRALPTIAFVGPSKSGKDEVAIWLKQHSVLRYAGPTSDVLIPYLARHLGVSDEEARINRHQHRDWLYNKGNELRKEDPVFLVRTALHWGSDIVVGVRDECEILNAQSMGIVDITVWIDRSDIPADSTLKFGPEVADIILPNREGLPSLLKRTERLARSWGILRDEELKSQSFI